MEDIEKLTFLYIVDDFPPGESHPGMRAFEISKRLIKENIFPIILTKRIKKAIKKSFNSNELNLSLNIHRTYSFEFKNKYLLKVLNSFFRFDFYLGWVPFAYFKARKILRETKSITFIYAAGPPFDTHIIGFLLKKKFNVPLIIEYRDPWSFNPYEIKSDRLLNRKINLILERKILRSVEVIITVSPILKEFLKTNFPFIKNKSICSVPNGLSIHNNIYVEKENNEITFTFTGSLYKKRDILPLLRLISNLKQENFFSDFKLSLKIFGNYKRKQLEVLIKKLNVDDIVFLGNFISRSEVFYEIMKCDLAVHIGENLNYPTIAFKVWDYLSCKKKILYLGLENSYTAKFLNNNEFGIVVPINNFLKAKKILKNLLISIKNKNFNNTIDEKKLLKYTWDNRATKFEKAIKKYFLI